MTLIRGDSISALPQLTVCPDVIYLDPMFPERKKSGLIKKKFQLLQQLESPCCNEDDLLHSRPCGRPEEGRDQEAAQGSSAGGCPSGFFPLR